MTNDNGSLLDLTIIIFSRDRHRELSKTIRYYESIGVNLLVLHRSSEQIAIDPASELLTYVFTNLSFAQRCIEIKNLVTTHYVIMASDDERYLPSTLKIMVSELERNIELNSIGGQALALKKYGFRNAATWNFSNLKSYENFSDDYSVRLNDHFGKFVMGVRIGSLYRMYRFNEFCTLMDIFGNLESIQTPYIYECTAEIFAIWIGRFRYINNLFWIRNWNVPMITTKDWNRKLTFSRWLKDDLYSKEVSEWKELMSLKLSMELSTLESTLLCDNRCTLDSKIDSSFVKPNLKVNDYVKFLFRFFFLNKTLPNNRETTLQQLKDNGISVNIDEFNRAAKSMG